MTHLSRLASLVVIFCTLPPLAASAQSQQEMNAEADFSADAQARGGSTWPLVHEGTRARPTKERVESLRELLIEDER